MKPKPLFNIFSRKNPTKTAYEKIKVLADYREKNCLVASELIEHGIEVEFRELKVGDYLVRNVAIERKTISDFISSMLNRRLIRQLEELQQYENKLLIIEGIDEHEVYSDNNEGVHANSIRGFLLSILLKHKIPILFTKDYQDTARFISLIARKKERESPLNVSKKSLNKKERLQFILESFPGIGPKTARKLLEKFRTIKNITNASAEELEKVIGKKAKIFRLLQEEY